MCVCVCTHFSSYFVRQQLSLHTELYILASLAAQQVPGSCSPSLPSIRALVDAAVPGFFHTGTKDLNSGLQTCTLYPLSHLLGPWLYVPMAATTPLRVSLCSCSFSNDILQWYSQLLMAKPPVAVFTDTKALEEAGHGGLGLC